MRRLEGISFALEEPVQGGFLRFGDVTVLTGRNDSGKTRVLGLIETVLTRPELVEMVDVFGIASAEELAALVDPEMLDQFSIERFVDAVAPWLDAIELPGNADEIRLGVRVDVGWLGAFRFGRAPIELEPAVSEAVQEALPAAAGSGDAQEPVKVEYLGMPDWEIMPDPIVVPSPASGVAERVGAAVMSVCRALQRLASEWRWFEVYGRVLEGAPTVDFLHLRPSEPYIDGAPSWEWLIDEQRHASVVHPAAVEACAALERIAAGLLPDFIAGEYRLEITPAQPSDIAHGHFVRLQLMRRDTQLYPENDPDHEEEGTEGEKDPDDWLPVDPDDGALRFGLDDAPAGFAVWLQLALCEAAHRARIVSYNLQTGIRRLARIRQEIEDEPGNVPLDELGDIDEMSLAEETEPDLDRLDEVKEMLHDALGYLREPTLLPPRPAPAEDEPSEPYWEFDDPDIFEFFQAPRYPVYLLDEPEQHLHPALERRAARWLSTAMSQWGAQCVIATHAIAFIDIPGDRHVYELSRTEYTATIAPLDPRTLTPYTPIARAIGLDRGELLARSRAFVFLEPTTATVLDELFAERLDRSHIRLVPIDLKEPGELPEIRILTQLTAAPLTALFISTTPEDIARLRTATDDERAQAAQRPGELGAVAAILDLAVHQHRQIEILTLGSPDILAPLSDDATRAVIRERVDDAIWQIEQQIITAETAEQTVAGPTAPEEP
jgi:AAA domain, putative AbiEii toxin, Type IV TA system